MGKEIKLMFFLCFGLHAPEVSGSFGHSSCANGIHDIVVGKEYVVNDFYEEDVFLDVSIKLHEKSFVELKLKELSDELKFFEKKGLYPFKIRALFQRNNDGVFYVKDASFFKILYCKGVSDPERHRLRCKNDCTISSCGCSSTQKIYHNLFPEVRLGENPYYQVFLPGFEVMLRAFGIRDYFDFLFCDAFNALLEIEFIENTVS